MVVSIQMWNHGVWHRHIWVTHCCPSLGSHCRSICTTSSRSTKEQGGVFCGAPVAFLIQLKEYIRNWAARMTSALLDIKATFGYLPKMNWFLWDTKIDQRFSVPSSWIFIPDMCPYSSSTPVSSISDINTVCHVYTHIHKHRHIDICVNTHTHFFFIWCGKHTHIHMCIR